MGSSRRSHIKKMGSGLALLAGGSFTGLEMDKIHGKLLEKMSYESPEEENLGPDFYSELEEKCHDHPYSDYPDLDPEMPLEGPIVICYNVYMEETEVDWKASERFLEKMWDSGLKAMDFHKEEKIPLEEVSADTDEKIGVDEVVGEPSFSNLLFDDDRGIVSEYVSDEIEQYSVSVLHIPHEEVVSDTWYAGRREGKGFAISERCVVTQSGLSYHDAYRKLHEVGHNMGLVHNEDEKSVMHEKMEGNEYTEEEKELVKKRIT